MTWDFSPSQRWRSTIKLDGGFPYCHIRQVKKDELLNAWQALGPPETVLDRAIDLHCVETNELEGMVTFGPTVNYGSPVVD
jgi:hypothetical protein